MLIEDNEEYNSRMEEVRSIAANLVLHSNNLKDVKVLVTDDIICDCTSYGKNINEDILAILLPPDEKHNDFIILISYREFYSPNYDYVGTLIHEFTHADDYIKFGNDYCNGNYKEIDFHKMYTVLHQWSEFRAYYNQNVYHINILNNIGFNIDVKEQFNDYFNRFNNKITDVLNSKNKGYALFNYLGNYASCNLYDNSLIDGCKINQQIFDKYDKQNIIRLYKFLYANINYPKSKDKFNELAEIMVKVFI